MNYYHDIMQLIGTAVDAVGVMIIVIGAVVATVHFVSNQRPDFSTAYRSYRQGLGRAILLGLEFLIAGDIIRTVVVAPTLENVLILAMIVTSGHSSAWRCSWKWKGAGPGVAAMS
jgi:uncharacterized membrane protein